MSGWNFAFGLSPEAVKNATPPGTVLLIEHTSNQDGNVVKVPVPTADPADPLNWPQWRKVMCMVSVAYYAFVSNYISSSIAPALPLWNHAFPQDQRPMQDLIQLVSFNVLILGLGNIFWVPLANILGRRLILNLSTMLLSSASGLGMVLTGYKATMLIRILQGLGSSASETVTPALVGDLFFVHERGSWMAFYSASLASGSVVGGIMGGYIAFELGWVRQFYIATALSAVSCVLTAFFVPETMYSRKPTLPIGHQLPHDPRIWAPLAAPTNSLQVSAPTTPWPQPSAAAAANTIGVSRLATGSSGLTPPAIAARPVRPRRTSEAIPLALLPHHPANANPTPRTTIADPRHRPYTFGRSLKFSPYRGGVARHFKKPWTTLRLPATWIIMLQYGGLVGGVAVISTVGPQVLARPPYRWGERTGLLFVGALVGIVLGGLYTGLVTDRQLKKRARKLDTGYAEPEARVGLMVPALAVGTLGLAVFGGCAQSPGQYQWVGLEVAYGMVAFALAQVPSIWFNYLIDSYDQLASDCFVMICILRGAIPFAWTFFVAQWIEEDGFLVPFGTFAGIMAFFSLLIIPILCGGKRIRIATAPYVEKSQ